MTNYPLLFALMLAALPCKIQAPSALNIEDFEQYWTIESESPDYKLSFDDGCCEIISPKGLTLWRKEKMSGNVVIEYDARVMKETESDRLSDLNCFWMASDPRAESLWTNLEKRGGVFSNCATMQLYYVGYGGNSNKTTRFRRYDGNPGPAIIKEYTDPEHLLQPNRWYHIRLECKDGTVSYEINGERLFEWTDPNPLKEGWFGFRTTLSRTQIMNFRYNSVN